MNSKKQPAFWTILLALLFFLTLLLWTLWQFHFNFLIAANDTFFHSQRIYEIRTAFQNHSLPSWVNFNSFFNTGQAINGMYPDFTLWPFVLLTNFLNPVHQIIAIKALISGMTFIVTFLSLNKRFNSQNAILAASIFTLSGSALKDLMVEMQTGTAIVMIFAFPIIFTLKDAIESKKIEPLLIIKTALLMTIVINSHLLSAVTITLIAGIFLVVTTIIQKNYFPWINLALAAFLTIVLCLPLIYRILTISKTGLLSPFGKGHVLSDPIWTLFINSRWGSKSAISLAAVILLVITLIGIKKDKIKQLLPWFLVELVLIIFSSNLIPWNILDHVPVINNFQVANWRFAPFLGMVPLIVVLINFSKKTARIILLTLTIIAYPMATKTALDSQYHQTANLPIVSQTTTKQIQQNTPAKLTATGVTSDKLLRTLIPDYTPNTTPLQKDSGGLNLDPQLVYLLANHIGYTANRDIPLQHKSTINSVTLSGQNVPAGDITLPVFGYKSLNYHVTLNGKTAQWQLNKQGFITVNSAKELSHAHYTVTQIQPRFYPSFVWMAFILFFALLGILIYQKIQTFRE